MTETTQVESKASKARAYIKEHPNATATELAAAVDFTVGSASVWLSKNRPKKADRGRPRGSKIVKVKKQINEARDQAMKVIKSAEVNWLRSKIANLEAEVANLKHQEIGYQSVISYLEQRLGEKNGSTV